MTKGENKMILLEKAINRLDKSVSDYGNTPNSEMKTTFRDSAIKRFEICFDLSWKALKEHLSKKKGVICASPKVCFKEAFLNGFFNSDDERWISMTDARNLMSHIYDESEADRISEKLPEYLKMFKELLEEMKKDI